MSIHFDEKNLLASRVGDQNGITSKEINGATASALDALSSFKKSSEQGHTASPSYPFGLPQSVRSASMRMICAAVTTQYV